MEKITLKQGLKLKNQLVTEIQELLLLIRQNNSIIVGNTPDYSVVDLMTELDSKILELVSLKGKIQRANGPVYEKIYMLSELKSKIQNFKSIPTNEGKQRAAYGVAEPEVLVVEINNKQLREIIKGFETQIRDIQDELDTFNAITEI